MTKAKWLILFFSGIILASGFYFFGPYQRVTLEWESASQDEIAYFVVYYGEESRHPWWDAFEEYFYAIEKANEFPVQIKTLMDATGPDNPYYPELEKKLQEAEKLRDSLNRYRMEVSPYASSKVVSGNRSRTAFWIRRGFPVYVSIRAIDTSGNGSVLSDEYRWGDSESGMSQKYPGFWI